MASANPLMSPAASISLLASALGLYVAALSNRFRRAPGRSDQAWFSVVALTASFYTAGNMIVLSPLSDDLVLRSRQAQILAATLHVYAWIRYTDALLERRPGRLDQAVLALLVLCGAVALIPGAYLSGRVEHRALAPLVVYRDTPFTPFGSLVNATLVAVLALLIGRWVAARRAGVRKIGAHCAALAAIVVAGANDSLAIDGVLGTPYLLDVGVITALATVGYSLTGRLVEQAKALDDLRSGLESLVSERTRQLGESHEALMRAEKLVALGQFSAGVAHEINNPAAVVTANLHYLSQSLQETGRLPEDGLECLIESSDSMERIAGIVRHLLDASRIAASARSADRAVRVADVVAQAVEAAQRKHGLRHPVEVSVPPDLHALAEGQMLAQVLINLLANASQAIPPDRTDGRIQVTGAREGERVHIAVVDNGGGMTQDLARRLFEPFFSTKPVGAGAGLGLAVSRGLVASLHGDLRLESEPGVGTRAIVELPAGAV